DDKQAHHAYQADEVSLDVTHNQLPVHEREHGIKVRGQNRSGEETSRHGSSFRSTRRRVRHAAKGGVAAAGGPSTRLVFQDVLDDVGIGGGAHEFAEAVVL